MRARWIAIVSVAALVASWSSITSSSITLPAAPQVEARAPEPAPPPARSPRNASYAISVRLDPASRTLKGDELLTWRNVTSTATSTLRFHTYYNAWRNTGSTWMRERALAGSGGAASRLQRDFGWIEITSLRLIGQGGTPTDLTSRLRYISPDDGNPEDATVVEVPLGVAVQPGQTVNVQIAWSSRVPRTFARTGAIGDFYFLAQWFPKIGVLENAGWNCHQFHAATEFFADFGVYDVRLTVPKGWVVGATGAERSRRDEGDGTTTHQYYAEDVHDFAWTTSPSYLERTATFEHASLPPVTMRLLLQPEHAGQADRHFNAARLALKYYGEWFGPYPYGQITIVDPAWQSEADGMEYPTLFTVGSRWLSPSLLGEPEEVAIHEAGHQFLYGLVASNEFEHAWMDEGFTTYATARVLEQNPNAPIYFSKRYFGDFIPWVLKAAPMRLASDQACFASYAASADAETQSTPTYRYWPSTAADITYCKTALWMGTLERMLGWQTQHRILTTYFTRYAFKHPTPQDFFAVANEVSGRDLSWFFDRVYRSSSAFDYGIDQFSSKPVTTRGYVGEGDRRRFSEGANGAGFHTSVVARRYEDGAFPVDVRVVFENGEEVRWRWEGAERWKLFEVDRPVRAAYAQVDPEHVLLLDRNYTNNSARLSTEGGAHAARKWSLTWLVWLQDHLITYGFFI